MGPRLLSLHRTIKPQIERYARAYIGVLLGALSESLSEHDAIISGIVKGGAWELARRRSESDPGDPFRDER